MTTVFDNIEHYCVPKFSTKAMNSFSLDYDFKSHLNVTTND